MNNTSDHTVDAAPTTDGIIDQQPVSIPRPLPKSGEADCPQCEAAKSVCRHNSDWSCHKCGYSETVDEDREADRLKHTRPTGNSLFSIDMLKNAIMDTDAAEKFRSEANQVLLRDPETQAVVECYTHPDGRVLLGSVQLPPVAAKPERELMEILRTFLSRTRMGEVGKGMFVKTDEFDELGIALDKATNIVAESTSHATTAPATTTNDLTAMKLGDEFDAALLGATITGQYAYSLTRLSMIVMQDLRVHPEVAQKMVAEQVVTVMREHGAESPVFVDDSLMFGADIAVEPETESPAPQPIFTGESVEAQPIFTGEAEPPKGDNVILIPGVTHGAIRGFLDPNGIKS